MCREQEKEKQSQELEVNNIIDYNIFLENVAAKVARLAEK